MASYPGEEEAVVEVHLEWQDTAGSQSCQLCVASTTTLAEFKAHCARVLQVELVDCPDFNDEMDHQQLCELGIGLFGFQQQRFSFPFSSLFAGKFNLLAASSECHVGLSEVPVLLDLGPPQLEARSEPREPPSATAAPRQAGGWPSFCRSCE